MESLVNYSSEDELEETPKGKAADSFLDSGLSGSSRRSKDDSSRRSRDEVSRTSTNGRGHSSSHREKDSHYDTFRKSSNYKEDNVRGSGRVSGGRDYYQHDRRTERSYDKRRDSKDDRKRKDDNRDRDRDHEYRDIDRDRRDRYDKYRRERHDKNSSYRDRRRRSISPQPQNRDRNSGTTNYRNRNRSRSRSNSRDRPQSDKVTTPPRSPAENTLRFGKQNKIELKDDPPLISSYQPKHTDTLQTILNVPVRESPPKKSSSSDNCKPIEPVISLPTYYNPNVINPQKYADQMQKRKLIWGAKKNEDNAAAKWGHATFSEDTDGKVASKFMRLMGIKSAPKAAEPPAEKTSPQKNGPDVVSRQAMFSHMEQQYEVARQVTHTMRGVGLGFGSQSRQY